MVATQVCIAVFYHTRHDTQDATFAAKISIDADELFKNDVCGVNANNANAAAITYIVISGFNASTVEQHGFNNSCVTRFCSCMQRSVSLQQARNAGCHSVTIAFATRITPLPIWLQQKHALQCSMA